MADFPVQMVVPIGAVLAAAITATVSFISLVVSKEQKISEFRQAWIDALRKEIAEFAANARRLSTEEYPIDLKTISGTMIESIAAHNEEILRPDPFQVNRLQMAQAHYAIRLRLNPDEPDHTALLDDMDEVYEVLASWSGSTRFEHTVTALDKFSNQAQRVLKREWTRVKEGEPRYKRAVTIAKVGGIGLAIFLGALIVHAAIRAV